MLSEKAEKRFKVDENIFIFVSSQSLFILISDIKSLTEDEIRYCTINYFVLKSLHLTASISEIEGWWC